MTSADGKGEARRRGSIRARGDSLQVRVYAGQDPVTGRDRYLSETVKGTDRAARRKAEKALTRLQADADRHRTPDTSVPLRHALAEWLRTAELEETTRRTYAGYIERTILPAIGAVAIDRITARTLETLYGELRRCRVRCDRRPFVEHRADGEHDCAKAKCRPHACRPMAASTVRQIHSIISATLSAAVRWEWIGSNPARSPRSARERRHLSPTRHQPPTPHVCSTRRSRSTKTGARSCGWL